MAIEIGALRALLSLDSAAFEKGAKRASGAMSGLQQRLQRVSKGMRKIGKKMSRNVTAPLAAMGAVALRTSLATVDAQSKMAQSLGTSTRSMQVLARASDRAGLSTGEFEQIARQLTKRLSQTAAGGGPAAKALKRLGLSAKSLTKLDLDQQIIAVNEAIEEHIPAAERAAVAAQIFGDRAGLLASRLDAGTIRTASEEIERFGVAVTEVEADQIEEANDAISALGLVAKGLANQLAVALAPMLKSISEWLADMGAKFAALSPRTKAMIASAAALAAAIGPLAVALGFMVAGLAALASPVGLIVIGLTAIAGAAAYVVANWSSLTSRFPILDTALEVTIAVAKRIADIFKNQMVAAFDIAKGAISAISALLDGDLSGALEAVKGMGETFVNFYKDTFPEVIDLFASLTERFPLFDAAVEVTLSVAARLIDLFKNQIVASIDLAKGAITAISALLNGDLSGALEAVKGMGDTFLTFFRDSFPEVVTLISGVIASAKAKGEAIVQAIVDGVRGFFSKIGEAFDDLVTEVKTYLRGIPGKVLETAKQTGRDIIDGFLEGIGFGGPKVERATRDAMRQGIDGAKDELDSHSPSRVFIRIGQDMMAGAAIGVKGAADRVASASAGAAAAASQAFSQSAVADGPSKLRDGIKGVADAMAQAVTSGQSMRSALANVFRQIAADYLSSGIADLIGSLIGSIGGSSAPKTSVRPKARSFDGGGYTWDGPRTGGVDGKGGQFGILHPNETVIDHTKGGGGMGGAVNVYQTIQVSTGVAQTVRAEIKTLMPQISEAAKMAVADGKSRGGAYGRAFG